MIMKNRKTEKNVYSYGIQLLVLGIIIAVLITGFLILINGIEIQGIAIIKNNFIVVLFCSSIIGGAFLSFSTTNRLLKFQTSFGITVKKYTKPIFYESFKFFLG